MSIASNTVGLFRTQWADRFGDTGQLDRTTGQGTFNATTGQYDSPTVTPIWDGTGGCLIRPTARATADFGEEQSDVETYSIKVPYTATGAQPGDDFTVGTSEHDSDLDGVVFVVRGVVEDSYLTHYEWIVQRAK